MTLIRLNASKYSGRSDRGYYNCKYLDFPDTRTHIDDPILKVQLQ